MGLNSEEDVVVAPPSLTADERGTAGMLALEMMHEIRNPLEALGHLTYLAHEEADDAAQVREYMRLAEEQVAMLSRIAKQTLNFAKVTAAPKKTCLVELTEAALRIHQRHFARKKIHLVREMPDALELPVHGGLMLQAFSNLIVNALEALPESGTLSLRLRKRGGRINLVVADNGHGISGEVLERLFEPFYTTKGESGNGLGLALTRKIVRDHGGDVRVRSSVREGRNGTAFRVSLPA